MADICGRRYERPDELGGGVVVCTYIKEHPARHSWWTLRTQDEVDVETMKAAAQAVLTDPPLLDVSEDVKAFLVRVVEGEMDRYLEAILAVTHNRKRERRKTPGFVRVDRKRP